MRLSGFKSFVDPTELRIDPGLTGIVGPNGCGKSNVVEALRWVMGENSAKSMRGSGMDDVIFAGTSARPPRNLADVTLTVANEARTAPAAFNDADTLEVSRRIERAAGSAYRINGRDVRAQDVRLLFADAATGAHSPALVSQGRIGVLITAKPAARRAILEEAAGVSGLHTRRKEAEKRLRAAETNLTRVADVIQQLDQRAASLKRQATQATKYRDLSDRIARAEAALFYLRWRAADREASDLDAARGEAGQHVAWLTAQVSERTRAQGEAEAALPALRKAETEAGAALQRLTLARDQMEERERQRAATARRLAAQKDDLDRDLAREREVAGDAQAARARLDAEAETLTKEAAAAVAARQEAQTALDAARVAAEAAQGEADAAAARVAEARAAKTSLDTDRAALARREQRLDAERAALDRESAFAEAEDDGEAALRAAEAAADEAEAALEAAGRAVERAETDSAAARQTAEATRTALNEAERAHGRLDTEAQALARMVAGRDDGERPAIAERVRVAPGLEKALGAALGDDLTAPEEPAADQAGEAADAAPSPRAWRALAPLGEAPSLPAAAEPLAAHVDAPPALARRLAQTGLVADRAAGEALLGQLAPGQRLVSRDGAVWRWDGLVTAADAPAPAAVRLEQRNRLEALRDQLADARATLDRAGRDHGEAQGAVRAAETGEADARRARQAADRAVADARRAQTQAEREAARRAAAAARLAERRQRLDADAADLAEQRRALDARAATVPDLAALDRALAEAKAAADRQRAELADARARADALAAQGAARERRLAAIKTERADWDRRADRAAGHLTGLEERLAKTARDLAIYAEPPADLDDQRRDLIARIEAASAERAAAGDALAAAETAKARADAALKECEGQLAAARETHVRLEANADNASARRRQLAHECGERFACPPSHLPQAMDFGDPDDLPEAAAMAERLDTLKSRRERMGAVNLRAEEELREVAEQRDHLDGERADLEAAIHRLRRGIGELNREGRERLMAAFEQVNRHFADLFTSLFGGGEAHLALVDSDDPLEAGLEIMASPPGKRLQSLSLLSGGEQALTALSLIFAVFVTNPAPICVLDEVDAPLDDANVERFCDLLDHMVERTRTRFLVVTHNAVTMSRVSRLFGVTMPERGVSQLVSVDLDEAEAMAASV
nr:chromosome segregation protein SMC [Rhodothalassium salexigens]